MSAPKAASPTPEVRKFPQPLLDRAPSSRELKISRFHAEAQAHTLTKNTTTERLIGYVAPPRFQVTILLTKCAQTKNDKYRVSKLLALPPIFNSCTGALAPVYAIGVAANEL